MTYGHIVLSDTVVNFIIIITLNNYFEEGQVQKDRINPSV